MIRVYKNIKDKDNYYAIFNKLEKLEELLRVLYKPLHGKYVVLFECSNYNDFKIVKNLQHAPYIIDISVDKNLFTKIATYYPKYISENKTKYQVFEEAVAKYELNIDNKIYYQVYNAINYYNLDTVETLSLLSDKFGSKLITASNISEMLVLQDFIYGRDVIVAYLYTYKFRESKYKAYVSSLPPDICFYSARKALYRILSNKVEYFKSGLSNYDSKIPWENIYNMLKAFNEHRSTKDLGIVLREYERSYG